MGCSSGFLRRSVGYVGASDDWQDLMDNFKMDWEFRNALDGNIALTGEINLRGGDEFSIAIALGRSCQGTVAKLLQSLAEPFEVHAGSYIRQCAAMPLCWSHAEYLSLVRSVHDGVCFDRVEPAFQRYVVNPVKITHEMWSTRHSILKMPRARGRVLRLIIDADATIIWSANDWANTIKTEATHISALKLWFADLSTQDYPEGTVIKFRFHHKDPQPTEGINYSVSVGESR